LRPLRSLVAASERREALARYAGTVTVERRAQLYLDAVKSALG
jgi:hypothetical protein